MRVEIPERDSDQRQNDRGHRQGKTVMEFHQGGLALSRLVNVPPKLGGTQVLAGELGGAPAPL